MTTALLNVQITVVTYLAIGFILYKTNMIAAKNQSFISEFVLNVLLPVSVFASFVKSISLEMLSSLFSVLLVATFLEALIYIIIRLPINKGFTKDQISVARYTYLVSNGGLIGTPVIEGLYGSVGVMYCNVFMIPTRIMAYVAGESIFNPAAKKSFKQIVISIITNKIILAMTLALGLKLINFTIPAPMFTAIDNLGKCLSPFSLILVGTMLAQKIDFSLDSIKKICIVTFGRLVIIPLIAFGFCMLLKYDFQSTSIITLLLGMPAGSTCAIFAKKYEGDTSFASTVVFITTILSTISLVGLMKIMEIILLGNLK